VARPALERGEGDKIFYELIGYDRTTERIASTFPVPLNRTTAVAGIARNAANVVWDGISCLPLPDRAAASIAELIGAPVDVKANEYFLESA
jgi:hypothetical protein